jgi:hypothetical protein
MTEGEQAPAPQVTAIVPATPGLRVEAYAPRDSPTAGIPTPYSVVAWAQLADAGSVGGVRVDPVFLADGRAWTPDQFRARYGDQVDLRVVAG